MVDRWTRKYDPEAPRAAKL